MSGFRRTQHLLGLFGPKPPVHTQSTLTHEDAQPNESVDKRRKAPPSVHTTVPPRRVNEYQYHRREPARSRQPGYSPAGHRKEQQGRVTATAGPSTSPSINNSINHSFGNHPSRPPPSPNNMPPPSKRRRVEYPRTKPHTSMPPPQPPPSSTTATVPTEVRVKRERTSSPEIVAVRKPVTSGSKFYKIPPQCKRTCPDYRNNRSQWAEKEVKALVRMGLKVVKYFIRDDGMSIDCPKPVMNDTLLPPAGDIGSTIERAHLVNHHDLEEVRSSEPRRKSKESGSTPNGTRHQTNGHSAPSPRQTLTHVRRSPSPDIQEVPPPSARRPENLPSSQRPKSASTIPPPPSPSQPPPPSSSQTKSRPLLRQTADQTSPSHLTAPPHTKTTNPSCPSPSNPFSSTLKPRPISLPTATSVNHPLPSHISQTTETAFPVGPQLNVFRESSLPPIVYKAEPGPDLDPDPDVDLSQDEATFEELFADSDPVSPAASNAQATKLGCSPAEQSPPVLRPTEPSPIPARPSSERTPEVLQEYNDVTADVGNADDWPSAEDEESMTKAALQYIKRYITTFDEDRARLAGAYTGDVTFSCRVVGALAKPLPKEVSEGKIFQGRLDTLGALRAFDTLKFCAEGSANVKYDVVCLGKRTGVLLSVASTLRDTRGGGPVRCSWSFVLRSNGSKATGGSKDTLWPLVATAHQMIVYPLFS
ncbi:hypothetical protein OF83DRAFT_573933 [Amylostereum chailletii]|nr:hypothetical protein OF83DRAFT_573933 [Amylostereum chailletii]